MDTQRDLYKVILYRTILCQCYEESIRLKNDVTYLTIKNYEGNMKKISNNITNLDLDNFINKPLKSGDIPNSITHLKLNSYLNLKEQYIPKSVTHLTLNYYYHPIKEGDIPNSVTHLNLHCYDLPLKEGDIPNNVTHLTFGDHFNQPLKIGDIPNSVTYLKFGYLFNQNPVNIPNSVTHLVFGYKFNKPLNDNNIPKNIIELILSNKFNEELIINKNILVGIDIEGKIVYKELCTSLINYFHPSKDIYTYDMINTFIEKNFAKEKLIGNIIYKELINKVFNPSRLLNISTIYNIDIQQLLNIY